MLSRSDTTEIKGVAILVMIAYHLFGCPEKYDAYHASWIGTPITKSLVLCVPIYLFLSGYGLQCCGVMRLSTLFKRLKKLYISFWWIFIPFVGMGICIGYYDFPVDLWMFIKNLLGLTYSYNLEWWFLGIYLGQLIAYIIISRIEVKWIHYCLLMFFVFVTTRLLLKFINVNVWISLFMIYVNIFMLGAFFAKFHIFSNIKEYVYKYCESRIMQIIGAFCCILGAFLLRAYSPSVGLIELISVPMFVFGVNFLFEKTPLCSNLFLFLGKHSMNLWLIHSFFLFYYLNGLTLFFHNEILRFIVLLVQSLLGSILIENLKKLNPFKLQIFNIR